MNPEIKTKWLQALRSGEYSQTGGQLKHTDRICHTGESFCCLGVLCDLAAKENLGDLAAKDNLGFWNGDEFKCGNFTSRQVLPVSVVEWAGLTSVCPVVNYPLIGPIKIAALNDSYCNFKEIADIIEEQL